MNSRIAWAVAALAVGAILALPVEAAAQDLARRGAHTQASPPSGGARSAPSGQGNLFDFFDVVEAGHTANIAPVEPARAPATDPLASTAIVCLAGCDKAAGSVVYESRTRATLASVSAPTLATAPPPLNTAAAAVDSKSLPLTCLAGCADAPTGRTVASLRQQHAKAPVSDGARHRGRLVVVEAPAVAAKPEAPAPGSAREDTARADRAVRLRSGFGATAEAARQRPGSRTRQATLAKSKAPRPPQPEYGKVIKVAPTATPEATIAKAAEPAAAPTDATVPAPDVKSPPVSTFAPTPRKPERKRTERVQPVASVSTDWFNKLKREQDAAKAAAQ